MPPKPSSSSKRAKPSSSRTSTLKLDPVGPPAAKKQKQKPLISLSKAPVFDLTGSQPSQSQLPSGSQGDLKGKGKAKVQRKPPLPPTLDVSGQPSQQEQMWVDMYEPMSEETLAVHVRKVQDIRQWLLEAFDGGPSGKLRNYRRILVLTGPADSSDDHEGLSEKFQAFVARAATCRPIFTPSDTPGQASSSSYMGKRQTVVNTSSPPIAPIVVIVSDAGLRGESGQEEGSSMGWKPGGKDAVDIRTVLPPSLLVSPYVTQIKFNPIAPTLMKKALQHLVSSHFGSSQSSVSPPSKEVLDVIVETSNGDIRSAIMALQFACISDGTGSKAKSKTKAKKVTLNRGLMEAVTRREQSLVLFHLVGKVLYNKRKGDAPAPSSSKKDIERDKAIDVGLKDPPNLPKHLKAHDRKASRVDVEALYADSPIDSSLLSLYIHQNYTQYCNELDECGGIVDWLSWVDCSGGEHVCSEHNTYPCSTSHQIPDSGTLQILIVFISSV
ncbi:hypothetical protein EUX98_g1842 [Antrodiella citrinella]|uniref:Checkpoint protein RAD24-like helical bundle domain-containing protein n=1 Tax=Antrodiella citrinella TaxID=2447956 RepID=A0A4S4N8R9_9APHY|nr:hypothetical protein EUX98_g1842 [Antrodiella citrinella]